MKRFATIMAMGTTAVSAFDPSSITGLVAWFKVDSLSLNDGDPVTIWVESTGSGNNASEATNPPAYRATGGPNSHPCVEFDGTNDTLGVPISFNQPNTVLAVYDTGRPLESNAGARQVLLGDNGGTFGCYAGSVLSTSPAVTAASGTFVVHTVIFNGASSANFINGVAKGTGNAGSNNNGGWTMYKFDASNFFAGKLCEILIYNSSLSGTDRGNVETYLSGKYGL